MNAVPAPPHGLPAKGGMAVFLGILVLVWVVATLWCAASCLKDGWTWLWTYRGNLRRIFEHRKESDT